jgi:hypothetical protein
MQILIAHAQQREQHPPADGEEDDTEGVQAVQGQGSDVITTTVYSSQ